MWCEELKPVAALQKLPVHLPSSPAGRLWPHAGCVSLWSVIRQDRDKTVNCVAVKLSRLSRQIIHSEPPTWRTDSDWESVFRWDCLLPKKKKKHFHIETFKNILELKGVMQKAEKHKNRNPWIQFNPWIWKQGRYESAQRKTTIQTDRNTVASRWV